MTDENSEILLKAAFNSKADQVLALLNEMKATSTQDAVHQKLAEAAVGVAAAKQIYADHPSAKV